MGLIQWAKSPWGDQVPIHIAWGLLWVAAAAAVLFSDRPRDLCRILGQADVRACPRRCGPVASLLPERVVDIQWEPGSFTGSCRSPCWRCSSPLFCRKWAFSSLGYLPLDRGDRSHRISILYHIIHATFVLDFWSIWPNKQDLEDASRRMKRALGQPAPEPKRFGKYPLENKLFHLTILLTGLSVDRSPACS